MSQENVEVVRALYVAVAQRDAEAVSACYDPDVEWHDDAWLDVGVHRGFGGIRTVHRAFREQFDRVEFEPYDFVTTDDRVVVTVHVVGHGRMSGVTVEREVPVVFELHGARITRVDVFATRHAALEAVGLAE